jgi:hypothetical protein
VKKRCPVCFVEISDDEVVPAAPRGFGGEAKGSVIAGSRGVTYQAVFECPDCRTQLNPDQHDPYFYVRA